MTKLFIVFGFVRWGTHNDWGYANTFIEVPKVDEENIRALSITIMRNNPNQFKEVCVTNFVEIKG